MVVGLGTGSQDQRLDVLTRILNVQEKILAKGGMGIVDNQNVYNTIAKYLENAGYKNADQFFKNPSTTPPKPKQPKPDPLTLAQQELAMRQAKDKQN